MIHVYTANTPNGVKIPLALQELGIEYRLIKLDLGQRQQKSKTFLALSPNGRIPAIVDDEVVTTSGNPLTVFESGAILLYLAEKYDQLLGVTAQDRVATLEWLFFQVGGVGPMFGQVSFFRGSQEYPSKQAERRFLDESNRLATVLESRLQSSTYLAGDHYTIADIANYSWLQYAESVGIDLKEFAAVAAWRKAIDSRASVHRGLHRIESPDALFTEVDTAHLVAAYRETNRTSLAQ